MAYKLVHCKKVNIKMRRAEGMKQPVLLHLHDSSASLCRLRREKVPADYVLEPIAKAIR